jgi:hypothetical protein
VTGRLVPVLSLAQGSACEGMLGQHRLCLYDVDVVTLMASQYGLPQGCLLWSRSRVQWGGDGMLERFCAMFSKALMMRFC